MKNKWIKRWKVPGSNGNVWTVALDKDGNYGCSCPRWKFKREECHHILAVKENKGEEVEKLTDEQRAELKLRAYAKQGFRYLCWFHEPLFPWERRDLERLKASPGNAQVKTFAYNSSRFVVVKETEAAYQQEFETFLNLLKKCNLRKHRIRNPFYQSIWTDSFWLSQAELRKILRDKWFDIVQHIIYNSTGIINPNLPAGSVYCSGTWGKKISRLQKHYSFLK